MGYEKNARDLMSPGARTIEGHETLDRAAQLMREEGVGALPIVGPSGRYEGILTDRDIVLKCVAEGHDPAKVTASDLAGGLWSCPPTATVQQALEIMEEHRIRRLPVIDDNKIIGMISEADLAKHLPDTELAEFVHRIYTGT
ncbi:CBS domain-containing protein [Actinocorallia sp. A-T 12471]|uniref:CBS domain-containing protein n=1 Tax=Actinocorallia sp. A-T 12471 TaxID=3089813 RepID=UPI0029CB1878|nr:CBS domain-containing protein [Actinocorallia sp. A-T 12471]MDX6743345.1 CBS domain-containing protein [Actinocorallia sp. A-T 12471]